MTPRTADLSPEDLVDEAAYMTEFLASVLGHSHLDQLQLDAEACSGLYLFCCEIKDRLRLAGEKLAG